jgi:hypothetical protein
LDGSTHLDGLGRNNIGADVSRMTYKQGANSAELNGYCMMAGGIHSERYEQAAERVCCGVRPRYAQQRSSIHSARAPDQVFLVQHATEKFNYRIISDGQLS